MYTACCSDIQFLYYGHAALIDILKSIAVRPKKSKNTKFVKRRNAVERLYRGAGQWSQAVNRIQ